MILQKLLEILDPNKIYGHDMSIYVQNLQWLNLVTLKFIISQTRKKEMSCQFIKNDKQLIENYRPISLMSVCYEIQLKRLIYNKMFKFFTGNELIFPNQSGLQPGDSCINQVLCIAIFNDRSTMFLRQRASYLIYIKSIC